MMSPETIVALSRQVAVMAAYEEAEPYHPEDAEEVARWNRPLIPNLGSYRPDNWRLVEYHMVDATGFGYEYEPAMTQTGFKIWAAQVMRKDPTAGFAVIEQGQFQVVVAWFTQDDSIPTPDEYQDGVEGYKAKDFDITHCEGCGRPFDKSQGKVCPWDDCGYNPDACPDCGYEECECEKEWTCPECGYISKSRIHAEEIECWECGYTTTWREITPEDQLMRQDGQPELNL